MAEFRFTNEHRGGETGNVIDVLRRPRLWVPGSDYPDYSDWLERVELQLGSGQKRAMVAYSHRKPIGTVLYQRHPEEPAKLEIRNISVLEDRGRLVGSFALHNTELEATRDFPGVETAVVDTKITNTEMIQFLLNHGYQLQEITDLYQLGTGLDAVFSKPLRVPAGL